MKKQIKIDRFNLWIIFGFGWLVPQIILEYTPKNYHWILIPILIFVGVIITFSKFIDKWLIK